MQTIKGRSIHTVDGYYIDLRTFFRFIKLHKKIVSSDILFENISIQDVDISLIETITLSDVYEFLHYVSDERQNNPTTRSRKVSSIRSFFRYLTITMHLLKENPVKELEVPSIKKTLPKYLTLEQSLEMLSHVDGEYKERDYCILVLFLNCGMRLSELIGLNISDIMGNQLRLLGKGNKERIVYLNEACLLALSNYLDARNKLNIPNSQKNVLFISRNGKRISKRRVQEIVEHNLKLSGLNNIGLSTHKLRHTAATLMYQHGDVDIKVLQEILGHANLGTTEIYTHISSEQMEQASQNNPLSKVKMKNPK